MARHQDRVEVTDFQGYFSGSSAPLGGIVDLGDYHTPFRSRGFQISNDGKLARSFGHSHLGQFFDNLYQAQMHGIHFWRQGQNSTIIAAGSFGLMFSRMMSETPGTDPYMLRFEDIILEEPDSGWIAQSTTDGPAAVNGCFAEYEDRLYYCNGIDWPIRIDNMHRLFINSSTASPMYSAMGVYEPVSNITVQSCPYSGYRADNAGSNAAFPKDYFFSVSSRFGESEIQSVPMTAAVTNTTHTIFSIDWPSFHPSVTHLNVYRIPKLGTVPQLVSSVARGGWFVDTCDDADLGSVTPLSGRPSSFRFICTHEERMFAVGGYGGRNRVSCSRAGFPDVWPPQYELGLQKNLGSKTITGMHVINGTLYLFLDSGILRLCGSTPENYAFQVVSDSVGLIAPRTLFPYQDGVIGLSKHGLFYFNGQSMRILGESALQDMISISRGSMDLSHSCIAVNGDYVYFSYRDDTEKKMSGEEGNANNRTLVVNFTNNRVGVVDDWAFSHSTPLDGGRSIVFGGYNTVLNASPGTGGGGGGNPPGYYSVTLTVGENGHVTVGGVSGYPVYYGPLTNEVIWVIAGASPTFTAVPEVGYHHDEIWVDGAKVYDWAESYPTGPDPVEFASISANHTMSVTFSNDPPP